MKRALCALAIESDSDMEPEDDDFWLPDGDDFVMILSLKVVMKLC